MSDGIEMINYIKAPASQVYEALVTEPGLAAIWTRKLKVKPEVGFVNEFDFDEGYLTRMRVVHLEGGRRIVWECVESDPEWVGTSISFKMTEEKGITTILLKHYNWRERTDFYRWCSYNWAMFLQRLKRYCEE